MKYNSLSLRFLVTISSFVTLSTIIFFFPIAHLIAFMGYLSLIWLFSWLVSRYLVEQCFLKRDIVPFTNKAVVVTGCDSGFGKGVAIKLSEIGYHVFACCFSAQTDGYKELDELSKTSKGKLNLILLDVTSEDSVDRAFEFVKQNLDENENLWALVNNAGVICYHGFNWTADPIKTYERIFSVNTIGAIRMTHKFTPLLHDSPNSRFVFLSSYAGRLSFSGLIAYCMSKHSTRVFGNCLRRELEHLNIRTVIIEPTMYKTEMTNVESSVEMFDDSWNQTNKELKQRIGLNFYKRMRQVLISLLETIRPEVDDVIDTIVKSVRLNDPYPFYRVSNFFQLTFLYIAECLPEETHDLLYSVSVQSAIADNTVLPQGTVLPSFSIYAGSPGLFSGELPECTQDIMIEHTKNYYEHFKPK